MADIAVSIPHGGGSIKTNQQLRNQNIQHAFAYCWLGGTATTGPDNNLFMSVRLQEDPDFAIVDLYTYNLRDTSTHGKVTKRSRLYGLGGQLLVIILIVLMKDKLTSKELIAPLRY